MVDNTGPIEGVIDDLKYIAQQVRPYNFWTIRPEKGDTPIECIGSFTSIEEAIDAFKTYVIRIRNTKYSVHYKDPEPGVVKIKIHKKGKAEYVYLEDPKDEEEVE